MIFVVCPGSKPLPPPGWTKYFFQGSVQGTSLPDAQTSSTCSSRCGGAGTYSPSQMIELFTSIRGNCLQDPSEGIKQLQCPTARMQPALFLLNLRFYCQLDSLLQQPCADLTSEAEDCDSSATGAHPLVSLLKKGNHPSAPEVHAMLPRPVSQDRCFGNFLIMQSSSGKKVVVMEEYR